MSIGIAAYLMCFALMYAPAFSALPNTSGPEQGLQDLPKSFSCTYQQDYNRLPLKTRSPGTKQQHTVVAISCSPAVVQIASLPLTAHPHARSLPGTQHRGRAKQTTSPQARCGICCEVRAAFSSTHVVGHRDIQGPALLLAWAPGPRNWSRTRRTQEGEGTCIGDRKLRLKRTDSVWELANVNHSSLMGETLQREYSDPYASAGVRGGTELLASILWLCPGMESPNIRRVAVGWLRASLPAHSAAAFPSSVFHSFLREQFCFLWWYCDFFFFFLSIYQKDHQSNSFVLDFSYSFVCVCLYTCVYLQ